MAWIIKNKNGEYYPAHFLTVTHRDVQLKESDTRWEQVFDWKGYLTKPFDTRKLLVISYEFIQGLISLQDKEGWVQVELVESAPQNRGMRREFLDIGSVLFAYACKRSFDLGFDGFVSFRAKTALIRHYHKVLGAEILNARLGTMAIESVAAQRLVELYWR